MMFLLLSCSTCGAPLQRLLMCAHVPMYSTSPISKALLVAAHQCKPAHVDTLVRHNNTNAQGASPVRREGCTGSPVQTTHWSSCRFMHRKGTWAPQEGLPSETSSMSFDGLSQACKSGTLLQVGCP
jgi:hypothetical protein